MRLNIDALQELYNTLTYGPVLSSPYAESPIDRAFKECDEKLSESATFKCIKDLQHRCDNLERSNKALRDNNDKLSDKAIELKKKNEQLEKDIDICKCSNEMLLASSMESISEKRKLENEIDAKSKEIATLSSRGILTASTVFGPTRYRKTWSLEARLQTCSVRRKVMKQSPKSVRTL